MSGDKKRRTYKWYYNLIKYSNKIIKRKILLGVILVFIFLLLFIYADLIDINIQEITFYYDYNSFNNNNDIIKNVIESINVNKDSKIYNYVCELTRKRYNIGGTGNILLRYMTMRSLCFWSNKQCLLPKMNGNTVFNYLPRNINTNKPYYYELLNNIKSNETINEFISLQKYCSNEFSKCNYRDNPTGYPPAVNCWRENEFFNEIMRIDMEQAFMDYNSNTNKLMEFDVLQCDITIHQRCGDILIYPTIYYQFLKYNFYVKSIQDALLKYQSNNNINCADIFNKHNKRFNINIISQINSNGLHSRKERRAIKICHNVLTQYKLKLENEMDIIKQMYNVHLINNDKTNDQYLMYQSPILIAGESTFNWILQMTRSVNPNKLTLATKRCNDTECIILKDKDICFDGCGFKADLVAFTQKHNINDKFKSEKTYQLLLQYLLN